MSARQTPHSAGDPQILESIPGLGVTRARGTTVPTDGADGYAIGCIFIKLGGGTSTTLYVNEGTSNSSCDFNAK